MSKPFTIAVDGPAAAGKGTISKALAAHFCMAHLDTGLLYRVVGALTLTGTDPIAAARSVTAQDLERDDLRNPDVAQAASKVAVIPQVRAALIDFQRAFARRAGGAVLDGRDIGTVICPNAEVKLFVTASPAIRARRRFLELSTRGLDVTPEQVLGDVTARDARDMNRTEAPLRPADSAVILDTTEMTVDTAVTRAIAVVENRWQG